MKYHIKTFGCQMNFSDSERMATFLEEKNIQPTSKISEADLVIFNTCGVRQMAEDRIYGQIHNLRTNKPSVKIVLTGCISQREDVQRRMKDMVNLFVEIKSFPEKLSEFLASAKESFSTNKIIDQYLSIKPKYTTDFSAYVPIMTGCNNFCAYCVVPYARGREVSRSSEDILNETRSLVQNGCKHITLLGQNVNSYNSPDGNINFSELLKKINDIDGDFWINFFSSHPKDMNDELIETVTSLPKACEYVHLPVQSGDNKILHKMNRKYTQEHYLEIIQKIKQSFSKNKPDAIYAITSDIIVGFPTETREQLEQSANVMREVNYDMIYFGQFSPRPQTTAWNMKDDVAKDEKVWREKYLNEILAKTVYANNKKYVGNTFDVIIEKEKKGFYYGKTRTLKNIKIEATQKDLVGTIQKVKVTKANIWNLLGEFQILSD